jgi:hypothetical protein
MKFSLLFSIVLIFGVIYSASGQNYKRVRTVKSSEIRNRNKNYQIPAPDQAYFNGVRIAGPVINEPNIAGNVIPVPNIAGNDYAVPNIPGRKISNTARRYTPPKIQIPGFKRLQ